MTRPASSLFSDRFLISNLLHHGRDGSSHHLRTIPVNRMTCTVHDLVSSVRRERSQIALKLEPGLGQRLERSSSGTIQPLHACSEDLQRNRSERTFRFAELHRADRDGVSLVSTDSRAPLHLSLLVLNVGPGKAAKSVLVCGVDENHAGNPVKVPAGEHSDVHPSERLTDQHKRPLDFRGREKPLQLRCDLGAGARQRTGIAQSTTGAVVGNDPRDSGHLMLNELPLFGSPSTSGVDDHRRLRTPLYAQMKLVAADIESLIR